MVGARLLLVAVTLFLVAGSSAAQPSAEEGTGPDLVPGTCGSAPETPACDPAELEQAAGMHREGIVPFTVVTSGPFADRREEGVEVIASLDEWRRLLGRGVIEGGLTAPDFSSHSVVVVYGGRRPTAGYEVVVEGVRRRSEEVLIQARVEGPPAGSMAATVVTAPYEVIELSIPSNEFRDVRLELQTPENQ
jgi:hypothetical protein